MQGNSKSILRLWKTAITTSLIVVFSIPNSAKAEPMREFMMSCTYGVLAGSLVGAATLAFRDNPGEHLKSIAVGASLGLYAGIILGAYIAYFVPGKGDDDNSYEEDVQPVEDGAQLHFKPILAPTFSYQGDVDGAQVQVLLATF